MNQDIGNLCDARARAHGGVHPSKHGGVQGYANSERWKQLYVGQMQAKLRKRHPKGHLWSRGKFHRTIGDVDLTTTISYIKEQETSQITLTQNSLF